MNSQTNTSRGNSVFNAVFFILIGATLLSTYFNIFVGKNFSIVAQVSCNPDKEKCFQSTCDPASDSSCPENESQRTSYYKKIRKNASAIVACESSKEKLGCDQELSCTADEPGCSYEYCDPAKLADGESCAQK